MAHYLQAAQRGCVLWLLLLLVSNTHPARAQDEALELVAPTFAYTKPADKDYVRAMLELTGVVTFGFLWYVTQTDIVRDYDVGYSWPVFRRKLLGQAFDLDTNAFGTNFVGHPIGGTLYYLTARSNRLSVAESFGIAVGGSLLWEFFGEVHEIVSANDMLVTPLAGASIAEPMLQLGAFFDRSAPRLHNRILGVLFAPLKSLNDLLDDRTPARSQELSRDGFPLDEWHQFDLRTVAATTFQEPPAHGADTHVSHELRLSLAAQLTRLPGYDTAGNHSLVFDDANASSMALDLALSNAGLVDLDFLTQFVFVGHYFRAARYDAAGRLWGQGTQVGLSSGYRYTVHDYDRDRVRPIDRIASVQPLGLVFEHRAALGLWHIVTRIAAGADFGGVRPYAAREYQQHPADVVLPVVLDEHLYYFALGGHVLSSLNVAMGLVEASAKLGFESYSALGTPIDISDRRSLLEARAGCGLGSTALRLSLVGQRRTRAGRMGTARAGRTEMSLGIELGARY